MHKVCHRNCNVEQPKNTDGKWSSKMVPLNDPNFCLFLFFSHDFFIGLKKDYWFGLHCLSPFPRTLMGLIWCSDKVVGFILRLKY